MNAPRPSRSGRRGFVLLAVLVFIMLISMVTVSLLFRSRADETAANASRGGEQAWAAAFSGIQQVLQVLAADRTALGGGGGWSDNPAAFRERLVFDDGANRWYFTVFSPGDSESLSEIRYGLTDEASRVNVNNPGGADLSKIPRMTPEWAAVIKSPNLTNLLSTPSNLPEEDTSPPPDPPTADFPDVPDTSVPPPVPPPSSTDTSPGSPGFAGVSTMPAASSLRRPEPRWPTLESLLRLPGFGVELLFGEDANRNGRLDPNENDGDESFPPDNRDGRLDHGMAQYLTTSAYDPDLSRAGVRRVDLNDPAAPLPAADLPPAFTNYVAALRASGTRLNHPVDVLEATVKTKDANDQEVVVASGITAAEMPVILDLFTTGSETRREGLINLNTAGAIVLATLPGMDLSLAESLVAARPGLRPEQRATIAWPLTEGLLNPEQFRQVAPFLTARSYQFRFHVLGYALPSGQFRLFEVAMDVAEEPASIQQVRDLTRLGLPFPLSVEATDPDAAATATSVSGASSSRF